MQKLIAFFMSIIAFFASLFGIKIADNSVDYYANLKYGFAERNVVDIAVPKNATGEIGLILEIHGGAWVAGDKNSYTDTIKTIAKDYGYVGASMNYRYLSEKTSMKDILDDITYCLATVKSELAKKGITVNKCILSGMSAGAHLSLLYAYSKKAVAPIKPVAVVSFCGPTDFTDPEFLNSDIGDINTIMWLYSMALGKTVTEEQVRNDTAIRNELLACSPLGHVNTAVPTVIAHGEKDTTVPYSNAVSLNKALTEKGITHEFVSYPHSNHSLANDNDCADKVYQLFIAYAETYLR